MEGELMIFKVLMIGHLVGDFYLQSSEMVTEKKKSLGTLVKHCVLYALPIFILGLFIITKSELISFIKFMISITVFHGFIDYIKIYIEKKKKVKHKYILFLLDQIIHTAVLCVLLDLFKIAGGRYINIFNNAYEVSNLNIYIKTILVALICAKPVSIFITTVFDEISAVKHEQDTGTQRTAKIGSLIGILEREIILVLGLMGQYSAIGFVLAAKSLARFKQLEERDFAEKYIVGTLLSAFIAIFCIVIYSNVL
jgi:hypothetical protein